ncbi:hypothetical protein DFH07DRAFT_766283 [Mycena maculata]|uniref:DUF6589 domain-containing protein n=1 Tax=Mycena maculata TaxID=230809 RepID=A0AAD7K631_9AGAR|nr:hypothetical protein DFH07DRAFT_766283 [Mycena maculata]
MPPKRKKQFGSDHDYRAPSTSKRARQEIEEDLFFMTSSAPTSPNPGHAQSLESEENAMNDGTGDPSEPLPDIMVRLIGCLPTAEPSTSAACTTPSKNRQRAVSESPVHIPSPATSTIFEPSPLKHKRGRPRAELSQRHSRSFHSNMTSEERVERRSSAQAHARTTKQENRRTRRGEAAESHRQEAAEAAAKEEAATAEAEEARRKAAEEKAAADLARKQTKAFEVLETLTTPEDEGGAGFASPMDWLETIMQSGGDAQAAANLTRFFKSNGRAIMDAIIDRVPAIGQEFLDEKFDERLEKVLQTEGKAIQELLTRGRSTSIMELLDDFSMEQLGDQLESVAPTLWRILEKTAAPSKSTRREEQGEARREKRLVFTTACAMLSISRSQLANNYQVVIGLFLLGSGASKHEMEVLAHAGLSTSYSTIREHIHILSKEAIAKFQRLIKEQMFFIVWDNLNIAFRVESQRLNSGNHLDNGTTATGIPLYNPFTGETTTPHGTLPRALPRLLLLIGTIEQLGQCLLWQIKRLAFENIKNLEHLRQAFKDCPEIDVILVHLTTQYPLPAMHEDESSIEGTIRVYLQILRNLGLTDNDLKAHGLMFNDGDLLTDSLVEKIQSARRNSNGVIEGMKASVRRFGLFHAKMAGCRLVLNEHWGKPNSLWPGSLWWEHNKLLKRKPISAGWKAKKATPWKPSHELLQISLAAHVKDGFRIHCGSEDLDTWALSATMEDIDAIAKRVYRKLFTTEALDKLRTLPHRDITHENVILLNRDALYYIEFVSAIKKGDIGRVINVLQVWMVMMHTPKTMPKYADAIFETLRRIDRYDPVLNFKEVDLLQEHQNFWAKIIYNAKGSNRSWDWLSMISIFTLRDTMRTVQKTFNITGYGECHTVPDMSKEIATLVDALQEEKVQEYVVNRPANDPTDPTAVTPVRDLLEEGSKYADTRSAFKTFTKEQRRAENLGFVAAEASTQEGDGEEDEDSGEEDDYEVTGEDLEMDDEEPYADAAALFAAASEIVTHYVI